MGLFMAKEEANDQYTFLKENEIVEYVKKYGLFQPQEQVTVTEVSDGKINHVYRLAGTEKTVIYKQAVPYARTVGESMPLPIDRVRIEAKVLEEYDRILPGSAPKVLHLDEKMAIAVTEDLSPMEVARGAFLKGAESDRFAADVGAFSAKTLFYTSDYYLDSITKKEKKTYFSNAGMQQLTEELVFDRPFAFHDSNFFEEELRKDVLMLSQDDRLRLEVAKLKHKFMTKTDALIHSDLHSGSIFVDDKKTVVFDTEFACFGPFGFDLGQFIANLYLSGIGTPAYEKKRFDESLETWYAFRQTFSHLWKTESSERYTEVDGYLTAVLDEIFSDLLGYAGCELIRRSIGIAQIEDLNYEQDDKARAVRRRKCVDLGKYLIKERHNIHSLEQLEDWFV